MNNAGLIKKFEEYLISKNYTERTVYLRVNDIKKFDEAIGKPFRDVSNADIDMFLAGGKSNNTVLRYQSSLKQFYEFLEMYGYIDRIPYTKRIRVQKETKIYDILSKKEIIAIKNYFREHRRSDKDIIAGAFISLLMIGLRFSEAVDMKMSNINMDEKTILVVGKMGKKRFLYMPQFTAEQIKLFIEKIRVECENVDYLFIKQGRGIHECERIGVNYLRSLVKEYTTKIIGRYVNPHAFRHSFISHMIDETGDLLLVKELAGHENLSTTSIYSHVVNKNKMKEAMGESSLLS